jgi:UPF0042 nucleotide-binding protein
MTPLGEHRLPDVVVVTGMSGAGRSTAIDALEDAGWSVVENVPPALLPELVAHIKARDGALRLAVAVDIRTVSARDALPEVLARLEESGATVNRIHLEASDEILVRRFDAARRPHPLQGEGRLVEGIDAERLLLQDLRGAADLVVDTTALNPHQLRQRITDSQWGDADLRLRATILSFGFKYGLPPDADLVVDVRFLPNPHWEPELRPLTGLEGPVSDYVMGHEAAREFLDRVTAMLQTATEGYLREGKRYVTIAVGCTGGKHRSVAMAEHLGARLVRHGLDAVVMHRDLGRE